MVPNERTCRQLSEEGGPPLSSPDSPRSRPARLRRPPRRPRRRCGLRAASATDALPGVESESGAAALGDDTGSPSTTVPPAAAGTVPSPDPLPPGERLHGSGEIDVFLGLHRRVDRLRLIQPAAA